MFSAIFIYELKAWLKRPGFYLFAVVFFIFPLFIFLGTGGYFDAGTHEGDGKTLLINSPFQIASFLESIGKFLLFLLPAIIGTTLYKDFQHGVFHVLYSYPIRKGVYLGAKFTSSFLLVLFVAFMPVLAFLAGELLLGTENPYIGSTNFGGYFFGYACILLPNLFVFGVLVFCATGLFRNIYAGFLLVLLLISFQLAVENIFHQSSFLLALLDPFAQHASMAQTRFWTISEKNTISLNLTLELIYNRILWIGIAFGLAVVMYRKFSLTQFGWDVTLFRKSSGKQVKAKFVKTDRKVGLLELEFGFKQRLLQLFTMVRHQVKYVISHWIFITFALIGVLVLVFMLNKILHTDEVVMLPLTRLILQVPAFFYNLLVVFTTFILSGMIVLRTKDSGMESLMHSTPTSTWVIVASHAGSLIVLQLIQLLLLMGTGLAVQLFSGYYSVDLPQYFMSVFGLQAPVLAVWALLSVFVFSLIRHLYLGLFILIMAWLAQFGYEQLGITTRLVQFNSYSLSDFSELNGYGHALAGRMVMQGYWFCWGLLLLVLSMAFWPRVQVRRLRERWGLFKQSFRPFDWVISAVLITSILSFSAVIYRAENQVIEFPESKRVLDTFKGNYGALKYLPQPRIISVAIEMDIFPERNEFKAQGEYLLVNKTGEPVNTLLIKTSVDEITSYQLGTTSRKIDSFPAFNFDVHQLEMPLLPGDTVSLKFAVRNIDNSLFQRNSAVLANGTYLSQDILPRIGYFLPADETGARNRELPNNHYQSWDSDLVHYTATISTSGEQVAFTNGILIEEWRLDGRNYYSYKTPEPVKFNFHFNSGNYHRHVGDWKGTPISIYHHPDHAQNLESITAGVELALEFNHQKFGFAPHGEITVIEYPISEGSHSTLKTNAIIMSESVFGVNTQNADKLNMPFYVAAHEMTHHWFGNRLIPKDAHGAVLLTESITEYLTLQIFREKFGADVAKRFLRVQHQRYFSGRAHEPKEENPLYLVEPRQKYIAYGKGAAALNAISQALGPDKFHQFLFDFIDTHNSTGIYPTSIEFLAMLKAITPDSSHHLIDELFTKSVVYESEIASAILQETSRGDWKLDVTFNVQAFERGEEVSIKEKASVELGIYDREGSLIEILPVNSNDIQKSIRLEKSSKPYRLELDPNHLILDRDRSNNSLTIHKRKNTWYWLR